MSRLAGRMPNSLVRMRPTAPAWRATAAAGRPACLALAFAPARAYAAQQQPPPPPPPEKSEGHEQQPRRSFKGQLTHSISLRLHREKEDLRRLAKEKPESRGGRNYTLTFGGWLSSGLG
jgi:hypothetical protein